MIERPKVGIGVLIKNSKNEVLIGKRKGSHAPYYSIPGGHLELGETFEEAAIKEVLEETGLTIYAPKVFCVTNNLETYREENKHYISVNLFTDQFDGKLEVKEPDKCEAWAWYPLADVPTPQFDASAYAIECYLQQTFYLPSKS